MKSNRIGLLSKNPSSVYNKDETFMAGAISLKTLPAPHNDTQVMSAPLSSFIDVFTDSIGTFLPGMMCYTNGNRVYVMMSAPTFGIINQIAMFNFNSVTGAYLYIGKIAFALPVSVFTIRWFKVDDTNTSNIKIFIGHLVSAPAQLGGVIVINRVTLADFSPAGFPTFFTAQSDDARAVYSLQAPREVGAANLMTQMVGGICPALGGSTNPLLNTKIYAHNGTGAIHQYYVFDYAVGPTLAPMGVTTATSANTTGVGAVFNVIGNTLAIGDAVIITSNAPGLTVISPLTTNQTIYFVSATSFVQGSAFGLSATFGGVSIALSTSVAGTTFLRGNGQSVNQFVAKTANLPNLGIGAILGTNSENYTVPSSGLNAGAECLFLGTTTNFFLFRISELFSSQTGTLNGTTTISGLATAGLNIGQAVSGASIQLGAVISSITNATTLVISLPATTSGFQALTFGAIILPSLINCNVLGTGLDIIAPIPIQAYYSTELDRIVYLNNLFNVLIIKRFVNSVIDGTFGNTGNTFMEAQSELTVPLAFSSAINAIENGSGWIMASSSGAIGQRGIIAVCLRADDLVDSTYIVTPVVATPESPLLKSVSTIEKLSRYTATAVLCYRTSANKADAIFNLPLGGWIPVPESGNLSIALNNFTQFKISTSMIAAPTEPNVSVTNPIQLVDLEFAYELKSEISDFWEYSHNDSSSLIPTRIGFKLKTAYTTVVPQLFFRAYEDLNPNNLVTQANTVAQASSFQYSINGGTSWLSLGTVPNTVGTLIRFTYAAPPGLDIKVSIRES